MNDALVKSGLPVAWRLLRLEQEEYSILPAWELEAHATCDSDTCGVFHSPMEWTTLSGHARVPANTTSILNLPLP